jgi:hypothetical protein
MTVTNQNNIPDVIKFKLDVGNISYDLLICYFMMALMALGCHKRGRKGKEGKYSG